jgi:cell division protease FtsH
MKSSPFKGFFTPIRLLILGIIVALGLMAVAAQTSTSENVSWPQTDIEAPEVSLSFAWSRMTGKTTATGNVGPGWDVEALFEKETKPIEITIPQGSPDEAGVLDKYIYLKFSDITVRAQMPFPSSGFVQEMNANSEVPLTIYENQDFGASTADRLFQIFPIFILIGVLLLMAGRGATKSLGLTNAFEIIKPEKLVHGFEAVAGIDRAREGLDDVVGFLKNPENAGRLGGRMPKGVLFAGPPGTGKTLLARAMAKEAGVPFITIEASGVNQIFVGAGAMKIKRAFKEARKQSPCIIFIDEIDALGRARGSGSQGGSDEKETTLNALLVELDGFDPREGIVLIAATNRPDILDPALIRRGRIDRRIDVTLPTVIDRENILKVHMKKVITNVDLSVPVARQTFGMSGADLAALVNEAALIATRRQSKSVELEDYLLARDILIVGQSSSSFRLNEIERRLTAGHEAGHILVAAITKGADPIERATIVPQGGALGFVMQLPTEDKKLETKQHLLARLDVAFGGREAERLLYGEDSITSGAESDIALATKISYAMVTRWGMSEKGFITLTDINSPLHTGAVLTSDATSEILSSSQTRVKTLLTKNKEALEKIRDALFEKESLTPGEIEELISSTSVPFNMNGTDVPNPGESIK